MTNDWPTKKIKDFCEFKYGKNLPADKRVGGPYPVYGSSSIASYHEDYLIEAPGLIIGRKGTVGKIQISKENYFPIDTTFYVDKTCTRENIYFLYYFFQLCGFEEMNSDAAVPGLNRNAAINLKVKLPPKDVQDKIATVLLAYDDLIENNLKRIKLLEEMAQITYEEWFVRMKFPGHETAVFEEETGLPEGWKDKKLGDILILNYGKALKAENRNDGEFPVYGSAGIVGYHDSPLVEQEGIVLGRKGNVGAVHWSFEQFYPIDTVYYVTSKYSLRYIYYLLKQQQFINNDAAVPGLNRNAAYAKKVVFPSDNLIKLFESTVQTVFSSIRNIQKQNELLKEARDILLPRLMTGMIDIEQVELPEAMLKRLGQREEELEPAQ